MLIRNSDSRVQKSGERLERERVATEPMGEGEDDGSCAAGLGQVGGGGAQMGARVEPSQGLT